MHEDEKKDVLKFINQVERTILEGDVAYFPNPALTKLTCNFRHKQCKQIPEYTDGKQNYYCWAHSIMIQDDKYA